MFPVSDEFLSAYQKSLREFLLNPTRVDLPRNEAQHALDGGLDIHDLLRIHHSALAACLNPNAAPHVTVEIAGAFFGFLCQFLDLRVGAEDPPSLTPQRTSGLKIGRWRYHAQTGAAEWSDSVFRIFGRNPDDGVPLFSTWPELVHPEDGPGLTIFLAETLTTGKSFETPLRIIRDGQVVYTNLTVHADFNEGYRGLFGSIEDVSEQVLRGTSFRTVQTAFHHLFASHPAPMCIYDVDTYGILAVNDLAVARYGYSREELLGMTIGQLRPPEEWDSPPDFPKGFVDQAFRVKERRHQLKDGRIIQVRTTSLPMMFQDRNARLVIGEDITEQKRTQVALEQSEERLRLAVEGAEIGSWHWDLVTRTIDWSSRFREILGLTPDTAATWEVFVSAIHPEDRDRVELAFATAIETVAAYRVEFRHVRPDGDLRVVKSEGKVYADDGGRASRVESLLRDITIKKRDAARLRLLESAIEHAHDVIVVTEKDPDDPPGSPIAYVNPEFERQTGYSREEAVGKSPRFLQGPKTTPAVRTQIRNALLTEQPVQVELINYRKDGGEFLSELSIVPVRDDAGVTTHFIAIQRDVSERRKIDEHLVQLQKLEAVGQLAAGIAHNFNNLLMVIAGNATLIERQAEALPNLRDRATRIQKTTDRGTELVKQLMSFSRHTENDYAPVELNSLLRESLGLIENVFSKNIHITDHTTQERLVVTLDKEELAQSVLNLFVNARDAMPHGGQITLTSGRIRIDGQLLAASPANSLTYANAPVPGQYVFVSVRDTGTGMSAETQKRVFEPFFTTKPVGKGTGLGLATLYGFVTRQNGFIRIESALGKGSEFSLFFPLAIAPEPPRNDEGKSHTHRRFEGLTVLIVDDEPEIREYLAEVLAGAGFRTLTAPDGLKGLALVRETVSHIDLLITDEDMPGMTGSELINHLHDEFPRTRSMIMSGVLSTNTEVRRLRHDAGELLKPFSRDTLLGKIAELLSRTPDRNLV